MEFTPRPSQSKVLAYTGGKMGISAVPGSGKTHTLSALAAQLIRSGRLGPEQEVLIVTLVNSAVDNFEKRIQGFLGLPIPLGYRVRTLHGLAHDIVREKPGAVGLEDGFSILDERDAELIRREVANNWLQGHPGELDGYLLNGLEDSKLDYARRQQLPGLVHDLSLAFIRTAKDLRLDPAQLRSRLERAPAPLPLAEMGCEIYANYQRGLVYRGAVDFDDLIRLALDLLESDREFLDRLRARWPFVLEDEAQDSSRLQEQILRLLAGEDGNWVRVGDPNQAIFETFTTASPQHLLDFLANEADTRRELPDSGRCQPSIIRLANQLIDWVRAGHPEPAARQALTIPYVQPAPPGDPQPNPADDPETVRLIGRKYSPEEEVEAVVKSLEKWLPEHPDATVAVLVPRNVRGVDVIEALKRRKIEYVELLASTASTRQAANRIGELVSALADPTSAAKLARAYLAWRKPDPDELPVQPEVRRKVAELLRKLQAVEAYLSPVPGQDWMETLALTEEQEATLRPELEAFRQTMRCWQGTTLLPADQMILTLGQDLFTAASDLALTHKLALVLRQAALEHVDWRLPELNNELGVIARNERRFIGFSEDDSGFDPERHRGKVVVTTMHKAKGLEWDRVYLMSVNNYDYPSGQPNDSYISEKWFIRDRLNLEAEALAQLRAALSADEFSWYDEGSPTRLARMDYVRERLRLLYVGLTRAKRELVVTWNTGRQGDQTQALPFAALQGWWEDNRA
jgi:DNA helicase-2/ATP-dependent DNA helicase PcrA